MYLNDHFATVGSKLADKISNRPYQNLSSENMVEIGESGKLKIAIIFIIT